MSLNDLDITLIRLLADNARLREAIDQARRETASDPRNRWCRNATIILNAALRAPASPSAPAEKKTPPLKAYCTCLNLRLPGPHDVFCPLYTLPSAPTEPAEPTPEAQGERA